MHAQDWSFKIQPTFSFNILNYVHVHKFGGISYISYKIRFYEYAKWLYQKIDHRNTFENKSKR